jgi:hypothetical protein
MFLASGMNRLFFLALGLCSTEIYSLAASDSAIAVAAVRIVQKAHGGAALRKIDAGAVICVTPVQNLTGREILMSRIDEALISEIIKVGYRAAKLGALETCDARAYSELVHIERHNRTNVEIEFRLVLAGEQVPRLCTTAFGKSAKRPKSLAQRARVAAEREAIESAFASQAQKIQSAQRDGMASYADSIPQEK